MENSYLKNIKNTVFTPSTPQDCVKILPDGTSTASREELLTEHYLQVYLNESLVMELNLHTDSSGGTGTWTSIQRGDDP